MTALLVALAADAVTGLALGGLGGGGGILAVPTLVHLLGFTPAEATTASLAIVTLTSITALTGHARPACRPCGYTGRSQAGESSAKIAASVFSRSKGHPPTVPCQRSAPRPRHGPNSQMLQVTASNGQVQWSRDHSAQVIGRGV